MNKKKTFLISLDIIVPYTTNSERRKQTKQKHMQE